MSNIPVTVTIGALTQGGAANIASTLVVTPSGSTTPVAGLTYVVTDKTRSPSITSTYEIQISGLPYNFTGTMVGGFTTDVSGIDNFSVDLTSLAQQAAQSVATTGTLSTVGVWGSGSCAVSGQATSGGLPVSRADISIYSSSLVFLGATQTDEAGNFLLNLNPANYYVKFNPAGGVIVYLVVVPSDSTAVFDDIATKQ